MIGGPNMENLQAVAIKKLEERGVTIHDMALLVYDLQKKYAPDLTIEDCENMVEHVLGKREVIHTVLTGIALDVATEHDLLDPEINQIIKSDEPLYGIDEILALSIANVSGSIALTNFGYVDKTKPGIIGVLDKLGKDQKQCHTFLDDIVGAIVSASVSRIAHK